MVNCCVGFGFDFMGVTMKSVWKKKKKIGARLGIITDQTRDNDIIQMFFCFVLFCFSHCAEHSQEAQTLMIQALQIFMH